MFLNSENLQVYNFAGAAVNLFWVNTFDENLAPEDALSAINSKPIRNGTEAAVSLYFFKSIKKIILSKQNCFSQVNTYETHKFLIRFAHHIPNVEASFFKGPKDEYLIVEWSEKRGLTVRPPVREEKKKPVTSAKAGQLKMEVDHLTLTVRVV